MAWSYTRSSLSACASFDWSTYANIGRGSAYLSGNAPLDDGFIAGIALRQSRCMQRWERVDATYFPCQVCLTTLLWPIFGPRGCCIRRCSPTREVPAFLIINQTRDHRLRSWEMLQYINTLASPSSRSPEAYSSFRSESTSSLKSSTRTVDTQPKASKTFGEQNRSLTPRWLTATLRAIPDHPRNTRL